MALSGSKTGSVTLNSGYFTFYLEWSAEQNIAENYSNVTVNTYVSTNNTYQTFDTVGTRDHSITIDGTTTTLKKVIDCNPWNSNGVYLIQTASKRVYHNDNGEKSITISARSNGHALSYGYSSSLSADATISAFTITLDTIPRASSISSISNDKMVINGTNALTVNIGRKSSSFTHEVKFTFGTYTQTLTGQSTSAKLVIPLSWVGRFGNGGSGTLTGTVSVQTKDGTKNIGSAVSKTFTLTCPSASSISALTSGITVNGSDKVTATISRAVSSFIHKVVFSFGSHSQEYTSVGTSKEYQMPLSWIDTFGSGGSGTKKGKVTVTTYYGTQTIGSAVSKEFNVTCPSASTISSATENIVCNGTNKLTVNISRSVSSFDHVVKFQWGDYYHSISDVGTSTEYAPPTSWLSAIPNSTSGYGTIYVDTYYGSQKIGATVGKRFDMTVPSYSPSLTSVTASLVQDSSISDWNVYIQKYSKAKLTFNGASGVYGSTIKEYKVVVDGVTYKGTANNYTTGLLNNHGSISWTATITDSRGKTASKNGTINVLELITPKFGSATMYRYNPTTKAEDDEGTQLYFLFNFTFESYGNRNSTINKILIKRDGVANFTEYGTFTNGTAKIISDYTFNTLYGYTIRVNVTDELGNSVQYDYYIGSELALIDIDGVNNSLALLKQATRPNFVQIGGHLEVDGILANPQGSYNHIITANGLGNYVKFATITIKQNYADTRIAFDILDRTSFGKTSVLLYFAGGSTKDPDLTRLGVTGTDTLIYAHKSATSTWDLYIYDSWGWDRYTVCNLCSPDTLNPLVATTQFLDYFDFDWVNEVVDELPSGAIEGSIDYYFDTNWHWFKQNVIVSRNGYQTRLQNGVIELYHEKPYIDFHYGASESDFTTRLIEETSGTLSLYGNLNVTKGINGMYIYTVTTQTQTKITITMGETHTGGLIFGDYNNAVSVFAFAYSGGSLIAGSGTISGSSGVLTVNIAQWSHYKILSSKPITVAVS